MQRERGELSFLVERSPLPPCRGPPLPGPTFGGERETAFLILGAELLSPRAEPLSSFSCGSHLATYVEGTALGKLPQRRRGESPTSILSLGILTSPEGQELCIRPSPSYQTLPVSDPTHRFYLPPLFTHDLELLLQAHPISPHPKSSFLHSANPRSCFKKCHIFREAAPNPSEELKPSVTWPPSTHGGCLPPMPFPAIIVLPSPRVA